MRKITILAVFLAACGNPKEKIVNQQIQIKNSLDSLAALKVSMEVTRDSYETLKQSGKILNISSDSLLSLSHEVVVLTDSIIDITWKQRDLREQYDSLEMELKKY